ncbi:hypothetical protein AKJ16_DCAP12578, partial [Drosera capensis]
LQCPIILMYCMLIPGTSYRKCGFPRNPQNSCYTNIPRTGLHIPGIVPGTTSLSSAQKGPIHVLNPSTLEEEDHTRALFETFSSSIRSDGCRNVTKRKPPIEGQSYVKTRSFEVSLLLPYLSSPLWLTGLLLLICTHTS